MSTIGGFRPKNNEDEKYDINTSQLEDWLLRQINLMEENIGGVKRKIYENIHGPILFSSAVSTKFVPIILLLPKSVLKQKREVEKNRNVMSIFMENMEKPEKILLHENLFNMIKGLSYNENDKNAFLSPDWRRRLQVTESKGRDLQRLASFHKETFAGMEYISILLDPIRLLYTALASPTKNDINSYYITINNTRKLKEGNFVYYVTKSYKKKKFVNNKINDDRLAREISRRLSSPR